MPRFLYLLYFLLMISTAAVAQKERTVYGKIVDLESGKPINSASVLNKRSKQRAVSNDNGDFFIWAVAGDSIITTAVGFRDGGAKFDGKSNQPTITMKMDAIALAEVTITEKRNENLRAEIKYFLENPYGSKEIRQEIMRNMISTQNLSQPGIGISIDALYDMYSKEGKSRQKVADLQMEDARRFYANLRYNKPLAGYLTKLEGEELDSFMSFCKLNDDFILRATDYDLTFEIFKCLRQFKR